jgi:hypothetical protein
MLALRFGIRLPFRINRARIEAITATITDQIPVTAEGVVAPKRFSDR